MINRRTFTLFSMCAAAGVSGLANAQAAKKPKILVVYFSKTNHTKNIADTIARLTAPMSSEWRWLNLIRKPIVRQRKLLRKS